MTACNSAEANARCGPGPGDSYSWSEFIQGFEKAWSGTTQVILHIFDFGLYPCCCRRSISCCPQRSSPVRSDRWRLGPREAVKQAALIVLSFSGALRLRVRVLPVAPASWTPQRRPGSPPWLRLLSAWWPGCTGSLDPALQPVRQHTQGHCAVICCAAEAPLLRRYTPHLGS